MKGQGAFALVRAWMMREKYCSFSSWPSYGCPRSTQPPDELVSSTFCPNRPPGAGCASISVPRSKRVSAACSCSFVRAPSSFEYSRDRSTGIFCRSLCGCSGLSLRSGERHHAAVDVDVLAVRYDRDLLAGVVVQVHAIVLRLHPPHAEEAAAGAADGPQRV